MNRQGIRQAQKEIDKINSNYTDQMIMIHKERWPSGLPDTCAERLSVFRNKSFLVQVFNENGRIRISVNRTRLGNDGRWMDNISWDELQLIKYQIGFGDQLAVEIYPREDDVVNVANMRHLWIIDGDFEIGWKS